MEPEAPAWQESLEGYQETNQAMQASFDTLCLVDNERVARAANAVVALLEPGLNLAKQPTGVDNAAFKAWGAQADKAEGDLRLQLRSEFDAKAVPTPASRA